MLLMMMVYSLEGSTLVQTAMMLSTIFWCLRKLRSFPQFSTESDCVVFLPGPIFSLRYIVLVFTPFCSCCAGQVRRSAPIFLQKFITSGIRCAVSLFFSTAHWYLLVQITYPTWAHNFGVLANLPLDFEFSYFNQIIGFSISIRFHLGT